MLFEIHHTHISRHAIQFINYHRKEFFMRSLQARVSAWLQKRKRALRFASCEGSATVETVLVLPVFLCAVCGLLLMGSLLLTEAKIQYALSKTADIYAAQKAVEKLPDGREGGQKKRKEASGSPGVLSEAAQNIASSLLTKAEAQVIFTTVYDASPMDGQCIRGGRAGILLSVSSDEETETVKLRARYRLQIELPFVGSYSFARQAETTQRIFGGYVEQGEGEGKGQEGGSVYVTEHGSVYHTSLSCSHISLRISGANVRKVLAEKKYHSCEKCIRAGEDPAVLYITKYGDKYHSSLGCSGLKRTVRTVSREEAEGMRMCSRCAAAAKKGKGG